MHLIAPRRVLAATTLFTLAGISLPAQLTDRNVSLNTANAGIAKTLAQEIGLGRGTVGSCANILPTVPNNSLYVIKCDPFRSIRRGRQIFNRKFTKVQGQGPDFLDGSGSLNEDTGIPNIASGLADSCAMCHGRPRGAAGASGDTQTRPDSRDSPHLFGLGLKEMLADEITQDLRSIRQSALLAAKAQSQPATMALTSKGISYGKITVGPTGTVDTSAVQGVDADLRVRPIFADGGLFSIRETVIATFKFELGLEAVDPDVTAAMAGKRVVTPSGMVLDGATDAFKGPPPVAENTDGDKDGVMNEFPASLVDHMEFYLLNYFNPGTYQQTDDTRAGLNNFNQIGCASCHIQNLQINRDRRVGNVNTSYDPVKGGFNNMFATVSGLFTVTPDGAKLPNLQPYLVENIFTDLKRHDLGPNFHENQFNGLSNSLFMTLPLWGVGSTAPYGHDGRSINLNEVILRHGGEAQAARDSYAALSTTEQGKIVAFLNSLVLFPPDDTASNLKPAVPSTPGYPQNGHGAISLGALFNNPSDPE